MASLIVPTLATEPAVWQYDFNGGAVPSSSQLKFSRATSLLSASVQNGALSLSGTIAQTVTQTNTYISFYIPVSGLKVDTVYNVSGKYKLTSGSINSLVFGSFGGAGLSGTNGAAYSNSYTAINYKQTSVMSDFVTFSGTFTSTSTTASGKQGVDNTNPEYLTIGMYSASISPGTTITLLVDDLVFAEAADNKVEVSALSSNPNMGTATVTKSGSNTTDFVKGDDAIFSAIPKDGYEFVNWTDSEGRSLSNKTSYKFLNLTEDTTLTANFKKADYLSVTYDYESSAFDVEKFGANKRYTWKHKATVNSSADAIEGSSLQLELCPPEDPGTGVKRGYLAEDKAYMLKAGNLYHLEITAKALKIGSTPIDISLVTLKNGDPTAAIRDNPIKKQNGSAAVFYTSSNQSTTTQMVIKPSVDGYLAYYSVYAENVLHFDFNLTLIVAQAAAIISYIPIGIISSKLGRKKSVLFGVVLLAAAFFVGNFITSSSPDFLMYPIFALAGVGWATINVNSFPMVVELSRGGNVGKYTGYYYTASMAAQIVAPILSGVLYDIFSMRAVFFAFGTVFVVFSFVTMLFVKHGDSVPDARSALESFDND